ncbi:hypothetical protein ACODT5_30375 [Streptomyces sp. 5.8]|uniref:hypothetical protein n=1 Tax=Streptomyces sp. 5.8 TaxID=3406571 RepID=UPI003BB7A434
MLSGAESEIGTVSPAACQQLVKLLDRRVKKDVVFGFKKGESYLLTRDWSSDTDIPREIRTAAEACPKMTMPYGSATVDYEVKVLREDKTETRIQMTVRDDSGQQLTDMVTSASSAGGYTRLVRVMHPQAIGAPEQTAADLTALH